MNSLNLLIFESTNNFEVKTTITSLTRGSCLRGCVVQHSRLSPTVIMLCYLLLFKRSLFGSSLFWFLYLTHKLAFKVPATAAGEEQLHYMMFY